MFLQINSEKGLSMLEVMIAVLLLSVVLVPLIGMYGLSGRIAAEGQQADIATNLAQAKLEELKGSSFESLVSVNDPVVFAGYPDYSYTVEVQEESDYLKQVTVTVYYHQAGEEREVSLTTEKARY